MYQSRSPRRRGAAWAAAAFTALAVLGTAPSAIAATGAGTTPSPTTTAKVDSALRDAVGNGEESTFFVVLKKQADLSAAKKQKTHAKAATTAYKALKTTAGDSQKSLTAFLDKEKVGHQDYWIANTVQVTGDKALVDELARRSDVASIVKSQTFKLDATETSGAKVTKTRTASAGTDSSADGDETPEWGVSDIKADQVWDKYEDRGEGIVIASVDSGVQYDHPDLVKQYRGNNGDGTFTNDYNFYDTMGICATSSTPCDDNGHGTHTMGTMVGAHGIGVAPNAKWMAAKACGGTKGECPDEDLLAAGQWILAPTDHNGQNPRPDLAPNIVNNSWGGDGTFYTDIVNSWNSAGIFEAFAAGNDGDGTTCSTTHPPGAQAETYGVGAYDVNGKIASFSGFGPSPVDGSAKPNISAPGYNVQSTWPGSSYNTESGTSMATPHVAGAVALLWSAAPSLIGKIDETRTLLNEGATDVDDTHCGGTAAMNNVWGNGKLNILASVDAAPHTAGTLSGTATDQATGKAASVTVTVQNGDTKRSVTTDATTGAYQIHLSAGTYTITTGGYGFATRTDTVTIASGQTETLDLPLTAVAHHTVSGTVLDVTGKPLKGATMSFSDAPVASVTTGADGTYTFPAVAEGSYHLTATPAAPVLCNGIWTGAVTVDGNKTVKASLPARTDAAGTYSCTPGTYSWIAGQTKVALSGDENAKAVALPFAVKYYGVSYTSANITTNGLVNFLSPRLGDYANTALPAAAQPNGVVAAFWDDLTIDKKSTVQTTTTGTTGARKFAIVWNNAALVSDTSVRLTFEAVFDEATGAITLQYQGIGTSALQKGSSATIGIENQAGTDALQYSFNASVLTDKSAIRISPKAA
ncbi:S8 family serine peptidase [Streptomyces beijiangensis]|uniref:S8 family serine peptidase n=1 Tax=Streptomyces beijiangensis TaxID=163361 RepID=A0A939F791_9ACTN|nr:S8 family serine peptidase [Streptomyces beijiangensis]MBO0512262.1 S8 family serine peptidase [Streptomyces beijiangensis]